MYAGGGGGGVGLVCFVFHLFATPCVFSSFFLLLCFFWFCVCVGGGGSFFFVFLEMGGCLGMTSYLWLDRLAFVQKLSTLCRTDLPSVFACLLLLLFFLVGGDGEVFLAVFLVLWAIKCSFIFQ